MENNMDLKLTTITSSQDIIEDNDFYSLYKKAYLNNIYSLEDLIIKLNKLKSVEDQWKHHRNYTSYKSSIYALEQIILKIKNHKI